MNRAPFQPIGEKPRWELIYDELSGLDVGDTLTYERLHELLDVEDRAAVRTPFYKAAQVWGTEHKRALRPVPNVGYRVVDAREHEAIAKNHHKRSKRQLRRGRQVLANADRSRLSEHERQRFDQMEATIGRHEDMIRRLDGRTAKVEKAVAESREAHTVTEERVTALEDALRRHGIDPDAPSSKAS
jgi:hypothetical protein